MKYFRLLSTIFFVLSFFSCHQKKLIKPFEGKLEYSVLYNNQARSETHFYQNGNYLIKYDETNILIPENQKRNSEWKLYRSDNNTVYKKYKDNDTIFSFDAWLNEDSIVEIKHYKNDGSISETNSPKIQLDRYVFKCSNGTQYKYGYNKDYGQDPTLFSKHKNMNLNTFFTKSKSLPLTISYPVADLNDICEKFVSKISYEKLDTLMFKLPKKTIIKKIN